MCTRSIRIASYRYAFVYDPEIVSGDGHDTADNI